MSILDILIIVAYFVLLIGISAMDSREVKTGSDALSGELKSVFRINILQVPL